MNPKRPSLDFLDKKISKAKVLHLLRKNKCQKIQDEIGGRFVDFVNIDELIQEIKKL